jgi:hypothetical protein
MESGYKPWKNYGEKSHSGHPGDSPDNSDGSHETQKDELANDFATYNEIKNFSVRQYEINESTNNHTKNALLLIEKYGTDEEKKRMREIAENHHREGSINHNDYTDRYEISNKYFKKLKDETPKHAMSYETYTTPELHKLKHDLEHNVDLKLEDIPKHDRAKELVEQEIKSRKCN